MNWPGAAARRRSIAGVRAFHQLGLLDHHDRVGAARHHTAGGDGGRGTEVDAGRRRMTAHHHLGIEAKPLRRCIARADRIGGAQRKAVDVGAIERRNVDRRLDVVRKHAPERCGEGDALRRQWRKVDMARETRARLFGGNDFEELLLPRGAADHLDEVVTCGTLVQAIAHGHGLIMTSLPAGKPSLLAGTSIQPSVPASGRKRPIARGYGLRMAARQTDRDDLHQPDGRRDLARELGGRRRIAGIAAAGQTVDQRQTHREPSRDGGIDPARQQQHRAVAAHAECRRLAGRNRDAMRRHAGRSGRAYARSHRLRPLPVPPMAMTASAPPSGKRGGEIAGAAPRGATARVQGARQQIADGIEHHVGIGARLHQADAGLAHQTPASCRPSPAWRD